MALSLRYSLIVVVVVLFAVFQIASSLQCYTCAAATCKPYVNDTDPVQNCTGTQLCVKIRDPNNTVTFRGCQTQYYCDNYAKCDSCKGEKCNSSSGLMPSFLLIGIVSTILAKYYI